MKKLLGVLAVVVLAVGGFFLGQHVAQHPVASTTTTTTSTTVVGTGTTTTIPSSSLATTCAASDFRGVFNQGQGAAGTIYASATLIKTTPGTCTMKGWPLVTFQDRLGAVLHSSVVDVPTNKDGFSFPTAAADAMPASQQLSHGSTVDFSLAYSDVPTGTASCPSATTISVQFRADSAAVTITANYPLQLCNSGAVWVSPFY